MRVKVFAFLSVSIFALLLYLASPMLPISQYKYENQLLIVPKSSNDSQQVSRLEEINEDKFVLTYEILQNKTVKSLKSSHSATIIATNYTYPSVTGYPVIAGGFFTKIAQDAKNQFAVLNETAAFQMFGSMQCDGETISMDNSVWLVVGIIDDKNTEDSRIYIPATCTDKQATGLIAMMDTNLKNEIYVQNALKEIGVSDSGYSFANLDFISKMPAQRLEVALEAALCGLLLLVMLSCIGSIKKNMRALKEQLKHNYMREIIAKKPKHVLRLAAAATAVLAGISLMLVCMVRILDICLRWDSRAADFLAIHAESFSANILYLQELNARSGYAFSAVLILLAALLPVAVGMIRKPARQANAARVLEQSHNQAGSSEQTFCR